MHRAFAIDVLACRPHCGGRLRLIATVHDPAVIRKLLARLGWPAQGRAPAPPHPTLRAFGAVDAKSLDPGSVMNYLDAVDAPPIDPTHKGRFRAADVRHRIFLHCFDRLLDSVGGLPPEGVTP